MQTDLYNPRNSNSAFANFESQIFQNIIQSKLNNIKEQNEAEGVIKNDNK